MDLLKTGEFIASKRKANKLTQMELAQKLNISEKTVSKWECGKGFPDTSLILPLCEELNINANELLSGRELNDDEYKKQAEYNIMHLKSQQIKSTKQMFMLENVIGIMSTITFLLMLFCAVYGVTNITLKIVMIVCSAIILLVGVTFAIFVEQKAGYYECAKCKHRYEPKFLPMFFAMHNGRNRYLKCPHCKQRSWNKKVIDKE